MFVLHVTEWVPCGTQRCGTGNGLWVIKITEVSRFYIKGSLEASSFYKRTTSPNMKVSTNFSKIQQSNLEALTAGTKSKP